MMKGVGRGGRLSSFAPRRLSGPFPTVPLWVFTGESNASGYALNSDATAGFSLTDGQKALNDILGFAVDLNAGKVWVSKKRRFRPVSGPCRWHDSLVNLHDAQDALSCRLAIRQQQPQSHQVAVRQWPDVQSALWLLDMVSA